ncbi:MAG: hypothetical protein ABJF11_17360 [Reichenbachiella sp.]|uniref:alginate O-acetyltransferase AlgX-related protein n=1 Tax=Reichenbachiella sp. TaxID=2184521 RepID=UPI003265B8B3
MNSQNLYRYALIGTFLIMIWSPLIGLLFGEIQTESKHPDRVTGFNFSTEKYAATAYGSYRMLMDFKNESDQYFSKNFPLRTKLVSLFLYIKSDLFGSNPLPEKVVEGRNGWLFLGNEDGDVIKESVAMEVFTNSELTQIERNLERRHHWLDSLQIKYYVAIAPNKHNVYAEQLPIVRNTRNTKPEQIENLLQQQANIVDLKSGFGSGSQNLLYYKSDTHWNEEGAYLGYSTLVKEIKTDFPEVFLIQPAHLIRNQYQFTTGDLARMLSLPYSESHFSLEFSFEKSAQLLPDQLTVPDNYKRLADAYESRHRTDRNPLKILVFGDSFFINMKKFMIESFGETIIINAYKFDKEIILKERPDVIVHEIVERNIDVLLVP